MWKQWFILLGVLCLFLLPENAYADLENRKLTSLRRHLSPKGKLVAQEWQSRDGKVSLTRLPIYFLTDGRRHWVYKEVHQDEYDRLQKVQSAIKTAKIPEKLKLTLPLLEESWKGEGHSPSYVVMERAHGRSIGELEDRLILCQKQGEPVDLDPLVEGMGRLGDVLGGFHRQGLLNPWEIDFTKLKSTRVHGDLHSENVFLSNSRVTFIDLETMAHSLKAGRRLTDDLLTVALQILKIQVLFMDVESEEWVLPSPFQKQMTRRMAQSFFESYGSHFPLHQRGIEDFFYGKLQDFFMFDKKGEKKREFDGLWKEGSHLPTPVALDQASRNQIPADLKEEAGGHRRRHHHTHGPGDRAHHLIEDQTKHKNQKANINGTA